MVLINIDTLSDAEIRYIAQQEDLEDWETLSREDLIENLQELYSDQDINPEISQTSQHKLFNSLSGTQSNVDQLPGVSPVTDKYNETYLNISSRDPNWVYAFWEISDNKKKELKKDDCAIAIHVCALKTDTEEQESFDIDVSYEDTSWNIELPWNKRTYVFSLVAKYMDHTEVLDSTDKLYVPQPYFALNKDKLKDSDYYQLLIKPMTSKDGNLINNSGVREIIENA